MNKIALYIMTERGYRVLNEIIDSFGAAPVECVISSRDLAIQNDYYFEIKKVCNEHGIAFFDKKETHAITSPYILAVAWRWLIPIPENADLIVFHDSLLPRYRGFAPLVNALLNKEPEIGVTAIVASGEYDRGDIIGRKSTVISYPIKINDAIQINNRNYVELARQVISQLVKNETLTRVPQDEAAATYSLWRDESDYAIDWNRDSEAILNFINAVGYPYKGASTLLNGEPVRILDAEITDDVYIENRHPGKVIFVSDGFPVIVCGKGLLKITSLVDMEGKSVLPLRKFRSRFL